MGKNFSGNNKGIDRSQHDQYHTPFSMVEQLIEKHQIDFSKSFLEPACGNEKMPIVDVLKRHTQNVSFFDIQTGTDFLSIDEGKKYDYIITNPPFRLTFEFIEKSKKIANEIIFLLPLSYLHGQKRYTQMYNNQDNFRLKNVYIFTRYPLLTTEIRADGKYSTGMQVYAWFIWTKGYNDLPIIDWIDNNAYITSLKYKKVNYKPKNALF